MGYKYLTGIKPTGEMHIGNYSSVIKPIIEKGIEKETIVLIADFHALTNLRTKNIKENKIKLSQTFKSFGIENVVFQSEIPLLTNLYWVLSCYCAKGLLNRCHSYKDFILKNEEKGKDPDKGMFMGLFSYPILMTCDLIVFQPEFVFIGQDQLQHINIANDIINKFNHLNKTNLKVPIPIVSVEKNVLGFDGRKMSKSYGNTIPLMCSEKKLKKCLNSIKTNSKIEGESKEWNESPITTIFEIFANEKEINELKEKMKKGIGWGYVKNYIFNYINDYLKDKREIYNNCEFSQKTLNVAHELCLIELNLNSLIKKLLL